MNNFYKIIEVFNIKKLIILLSLVIFLILLFLNYVNFITYNGEFKGEKILYVKMDGKSGTVIKINNKFLKNQTFIKNNKKLEYGFYLLRYDIKKTTLKNNTLSIEGKIKGYKEGKLNFMRRFILNIFDDLFITNENLYAFTRAAVLGEKAEVSKDMNDKFKYTGLAHLIVISGSHISLVIMGLVSILDKIRFSYRLKYITALIGLTLYCTLVGMSPSILRAYIMGALMILARILFEEEDSKKSLLISFIIIIILNPYSINDISMQLSYMAVISIIFVYPIIENFFKEKIESIKDEILKESVKLLILSIVIQIIMLPLFLYYFNKLPLFSFLLNIIGVPLGTVLIEVIFGVTLLNILQIKIFNPLLQLVTEIIYNSFEGFIFSASKIPLLQVNSTFKVGISFVIFYYIIIILILWKIYLKNISNLKT